MVAHPDTHCFSDEWYSLQYIATPAVFVYVIILPILGMRHISSKKNLIFFSGKDDPELPDELRK